MRDRVLHIAIIAAIIGGITFVLKQVLPVNAATAGFAYFVAILFVATRWGLVEATIGSFAAVLCFNFFFLPPVGAFTIADPQNWIALFALLITSITASRLSTRVRQQALEAQEREKEIQRLYALSRSILLIDPGIPAPGQLANHVRQALEASSVALYDRATDQVFRAGAEEFPGSDGELRAGVPERAHSRTAITPVQLGSQPLGSLGIGGVELSESAAQSVANLVAIGLERALAQETAGRAEAARQSDELKSTLLDAIAHEFKTPLTTIKASTTALLADKPLRSEQQRGYVELVDEEADRLGVLVTEAIQMARFEAGQVRLQREEMSIAELLDGTLMKMKNVADSREVRIDVPGGLPTVEIDREMMELALRQLLDNAIKYSPPDTPITLSAANEGGKVIVRVADCGKGVPDAEAERIFEKFYRSKEIRNQIPGAGLGLAIAQAVVQAHGGKLGVRGAVFSVELAEANG